MSKDITIKLSKEMEMFLTKKAEKRQLPLDKTIEELIIDQINSKINFEYGFYFDKETNTLYDKHGKTVELTKLQSGLFTLLLKRKGEIVDFDSIHEEVWKDKKMSIYTMRNIIKRIRDLTYYGIIINHSNKGYSIGSCE